MKPTLLVKIGTMSAKDLKRLRDNDICVVECERPDLVRFLDPPPMGDYDGMERAAIELFRQLMSGKMPAFATRKEIATMYTDILLAGKHLKHVSEVQSVKDNHAESESE